MKKILVFSFLVAASTAQAQGQCGQHGAMVDALAKQHQEHRRAIATSAQGRTLVELFVSASGSWTLLATDSRASCIAAAGDDWEHAPSISLIGEPS